jgi:adenylate cyclase
MTTKDFKRKLSAIFSADVAGYSRLMGEDEASTVSTLETFREVMSTLIHQHRGRVVDSPGDNLLAEFASVVDAVQCGVSVQKELRARNDALPENRRMQFRIGINLGDVIEEGDRIYGDGVNIAARLEALADPGGICVSKTAFDHIESKLPLGYQYLGEQNVKNIPKPVPAYRVLLDKDAVGKVIDATRNKRLKWAWVAAGTVLALLITIATLAFWNGYFRHPPPPTIEFPEKPSIAVLPLVNIGGGPEKEYIVDGITDNLINRLFQVPQLFVIARHSVYRYKGKSIEIREVSEKLRVRHVLEGSVQQSGRRLRINVQLIDAVTGEDLWAEGYDREMKDLFALQDDITKKIITALQVKLTEGDAARLYSEGTDNIDAYLKLLKGYHFFQSFKKENNLRARKLAMEVIELDPNYPEGYLLLGWTYSREARQRRVDNHSMETPSKQVEDLAKKALELNSFLAEPHMLFAYLYRLQGKWNLALSEAEKAISITPVPEYIYIYASFLDQVGRSEDVIEICKKVFKRDPLPPAWARDIVARSYFRSEQYDKARNELIHTLDYVEKFEPEYNVSYAHILMTATYVMLGQIEKARNHAAEVRKMRPHFSLDRHSKEMLWKNEAQKDRLISALRQAGLE